jgi:ParB family transcriptional regulator, chromosome partitioning protein
VVPSLLIAIELVAALEVGVGTWFANKKELANRGGTMSQSRALQLISVNSIHPSPFQYRTLFDDTKQKELVESMRATGLSTPILVRPRSANEYQLVSGERRWRAAKELGWESIQAICEEMTDAEAAARVVTENEVRADTNLMEKAAGYKRLTQPPCNFTLEEIAKRYGYRSHTSVVAIIALLDQPAAIQELVARATIGERHVRFLSRIKDLNARIKWAKRAAEENWSVKMTEERVAKLLVKAGKGPEKSRAKDGPTHEYDYNGWHCKMVGDEVILSGRNYNRTKQSLKQYLADQEMAIVSFLRDVDAEPAAQPAAAANDGVAVVALAEAAPPPPVASADVADLIKQAAEAAKPLKEVFSEIANKAGGSQLASDLLSIFGKPRSPG